MRLIDVDELLKGRTDHEMISTHLIFNAPTVDVLDKIRAEIDVARFFDKDTKLCKNANASGLEVALEIIDKYR